MLKFHIISIRITNLLLFISALLVSADESEDSEYIFHVMKAIYIFKSKPSKLNIMKIRSTVLNIPKQLTEKNLFAKTLCRYISWYPIKLNIET